MAKADSHTGVGIAALILGIVSLIIIFILPIALSDPFYAIFAIPFAILAAGFGFIARKQGDSYGVLGLILGVIALILAIVFLSFFTIVYVERVPL